MRVSKTQSIVPLSNDTRTLWAHADKPWLFLAGCLEWARVESPGFTSRLPITIDASANGIQHLSALSLSEKEARWTNLLSSDPDAGPQDIYQLVADELRRRVEADAAEDDTQTAQIASAWCPAISRRTVKRAVMATPYGISRQGIRDDLRSYIDDAELESKFSFEDPDEALNYLAPRLEECITHTLPEVGNVLEWLKRLASQCIRALAQPMLWTTPIGFPVFDRSISLEVTPRSVYGS